MGSCSDEHKYQLVCSGLVGLANNYTIKHCTLANGYLLKRASKSVSTLNGRPISLIWSENLCPWSISIACSGDCYWLLMCFGVFRYFYEPVLKILSKKQILTSNKGRNSVENLRKTMIYNTNVDIVNDTVYTKFGLNLSIRFQDIEQKLNSDVNQGT